MKKGREVKVKGGRRGEGRWYTCRKSNRVGGGEDGQRRGGRKEEEMEHIHK